MEKTQSIDEIKHPVVKAVLRYLKLDHVGIEIHHDADLPARSGLGCSSAFTVGLLNSLLHLVKKPLEPLELAKLATEIEQNHLHEVVGYQDQIHTAHGGFNRIDFHPDGSIDVAPVFSSRLDELEDHLMLFYSGHPRYVSKEAKLQMINYLKNASIFRDLRHMVDEAAAILQNRSLDLKAFGSLLDDSWQLKKQLSDQMSNAAIDDIYKRAKNAGAIGGKLLGSGGGGFMLLFVSPDRQPHVLEALSDVPKLCSIPFAFESHGSHLVLEQEREQYALRCEKEQKF